MTCAGKVGRDPGRYLGLDRGLPEDPLDLESIVAFDDIVTCLPVIQEVLQGFRADQAFRVARDAMLALPRWNRPSEATSCWKPSVCIVPDAPVG